ncbi:hypothetical protein HPB51_020798 [Rhipicephalus microplus]|uniref:Peptidase S1 domain-containing protein n=1 Tax=Rhipicephalus microplus TaxID=6941 RepID=A0A9J6DQA8_RHIMP|nr:hypothetical protein HPB51_020798 [Rhipicephalus microplus]
MRSGLATLLAVASLHTWTALSLRVLDHRLFGATRTIKLKPCQNRVTGQEGTCMFAWDCFSAGGTHLTYCTDSFYTGSCCKLPPGVVVQPHDQPSEPTNSIDSAPYEGEDDDYKKKTKRPPTSTPKTTLQMSSKTTQPVTYAVTTPGPTPVPATTGPTPFVSLSTFTPGLITWRPHETTLPFVSDEPPSTVPNDYGSSISVRDATTLPTTTTEKQTAPAAVTTTQIPIVASTFLDPGETTTGPPKESSTLTATKVTTEQPVETTSGVTETAGYDTTSQDYTKSTQAPVTSTQALGTDTTTAQTTTQRPFTSTVQSHTWIVNERETTMAIPQSVPTEQTWVVVDEADASGQQTTTPTQVEATGQPSSTSSVMDWSTVTDTVTSISWVDMTELSTTQKPPPDVADTSPLPSKPPPEKPVLPTTTNPVATTLDSTTIALTTEADFVTVRTDPSEVPSLELYAAGHGQWQVPGLWEANRRNLLNGPGCVSPTDILLRLGEYDLKSEHEPLAHVERRVQIVATHPRFDASTFEYDLALLRLYEPVPFQDNVIPVCVPDTNDTFVGRSAVVTGWGRLYEDGPLPNIMQKVSVPIITNKECESMYRKAGFIEDIPNIFICAGLAKGGKDSCEGDSGGPLVLKDLKTGQWSLIGIISWGIGCALPNQPGVYTRITHFADWIRQIIVF